MFNLTNSVYRKLISLFGIVMFCTMCISFNARATTNDEIKTFSITYHLDGGTNALKNPDVYTTEDTITLMDATKVGYDFVGWFLDSEMTKPITKISNFNGNIDIYAKFIPKSYLMKFDGNGADEYGYKITLNNDKTGEVRYVYLNAGDSFSPHEYWKPEASGYVYAGWMYESEVLSDTLKINSDIELVPKWIANPDNYPVLGDSSSLESSYLYYAGSTLRRSTSRFYTSYDYEEYSYNYVLQKFVDDGYPIICSECGIEKSSGWSLVYHSENTGLYYQHGWYSRSGSGVFSADPGTSLFAYVSAWGSGLSDYSINNVWLRITPKTKRTNIGKIEIDNTVEFDSSFNAPSAYKSGYTFLGWYDLDGNRLTDTWQYTEDQTFTAKWQPTKYSITYNIEGGKNSLENPSSYTIEDSIILKNPTRQGYTFKGWYSEPDFTTRISTITKQIGTISLYAKWEVNSYNLILNGDDGVFAPKVTFISDGVEIKSCYLYEQDSITAYRPKNKEGYIFAGWYKDKTCMSLFEFSGTITDDVKLYAKWIKCNKNTISVESIEPFDITINGKNEQLYAFVPLTDGQIIVSSESNNLDLYGILYDATKNILISSDDIISNDLDFSYSYDVEAGKLYYISVKGNTVSTSGIALVNIEWSGDCTITGTSYSNRQISVAYDTDYKLPQKPIREGYVFLGWFDENDIQITDGVWNFITDKTLTAKWGPATYHTVIFKDINGEIISTETYYLSEDIVAPELPTKATDKTYTYTAKWNNGFIGVCTGDVTYSPIFESTYIDYTVTFKDYDGAVLSSDIYHYGDIIKVPKEPSRQSDKTYIYGFEGWDSEVVPCNGDKVYVATYTSTYIDYTVTFKDYDGTVISSETYHYGDIIKVPEEPSRQSDKTYTYEFAGWDSEVVACDGTKIYTATYKSIYIDYTVTFKDYDGTVLSSENYHYGDSIVVPNTACKEADKTYTYEFEGWDSEVVPCNGNKVYTATYTPTYIEYTVTFKDYDDTVLSSENYHYGDSIVAPNTACKEADKIYTYEFAGWDSEVVACNGNKVYTATYTPTYIEYTVTFKDYDGTVLSSNIYHYGDTIVVPEAPSRSSDKTYTYEFAGWNRDVVACNGNKVYLAKYTSTCIDYTIIFKNDDGTVLSSETYHYGDYVHEPFLWPRKASDKTYTYEFAGWDSKVEACDGNKVYTATYTSTYINYTVTFKDYDGTVISSGTYHYGDIIKVPEEPSRQSDKTYTYEFAGWRLNWDEGVSDVFSCNGNMDYRAMYTTAYIDYTVIFKNDDGTVLSSNTYHYGDFVPEIYPSKSWDDTYGYIFAGWDSEFENRCYGDKVYIATYESYYRNYTVTFKDYNGTILSKTTYHYGDEVTVPINPTRADDREYMYSFVGWDHAITDCKGNALYIAVYDKTAIVVTSIAVNKMPNKLTYYEGDVFDESGMIVTAYYNNNTSEQMQQGDYIVEGYSSSVGVKTITVRYRDKSTIFKVKVKERTLKVICKLSKIKKAAKSKILLKWKKNSGVSGYEIARSTKKGKGYKVIKVAKGNAKTIKVKANRGKKFYYKIRAYKIVNGKKLYSQWSAPKKYKLK